MCPEVCRFSDRLRRESFAHITRDRSVLTLVEGGASKKQGFSVTCLGEGGNRRIFSNCRNRTSSVTKVTMGRYV